MSTKISLTDIDLEFGMRGGGDANVIYDRLSLNIEEGGITVLLGPSGCGKSTLLNIINGLLRPTRAGGILVEDKDIREHPELTRKMAYIFQDPRLLKWKTLAGNVEFGLRGLRVQPKDRWNDLMERYFSAVGLAEYMDYYPHQVSGGMQQRAAIVRAWVNEPEILLMDEPFSHLDEITAAEMRKLLIELWSQEEQRRTIVFVTHNISEAVQLATDIVVLTPTPSEICYRKRISSPQPRDMTSDSMFDIEKELRKVFADKAGVQV